MLAPTLTLSLSCRLRLGDGFATISSVITQPMPKILRILIWLAIALLGALALATVALHRGEQINAMWLVAAAVCSYALGYRFYSKFIAARLLTLDALRATPAERLENVAGSFLESGLDLLLVSFSPISLPEPTFCTASGSCWGSSMFWPSTLMTTSPRLEAGLRRRRTGDHRADNRSDGREMKLRRLKMTQEPGFMQLTP